jgi:hypothetical protein
MGLRCLLGHDFGDAEIEREREEEGEEMVVTVREVKTCTRCGRTQTISENKEVTSIRPASDVPGFEPTDDESATDETEAEADVDAAADAVTAEASDSNWSEPGSHPATDDPNQPETTTVGNSAFSGDESFDPPQTAEEDDGVILDDDDEEPTERQPGEWPDAGDVGRDDGRMPTLEEVEGELDADAPADQSESTAWPEQQGDDEGFAAEPHEDDEGVEVDFGNKLAPELSDDAPEKGYDAEFIGNAEGETADHDTSSSGGFARAETLSREDASEVPTEYYCPACEMTRAADKSSMRAGDICPECKHGYITERER